MARLSLLASHFQELLCLGVDVLEAGGGWARPPTAPSRGTGEDMAGHRERSQGRAALGAKRGRRWTGQDPEAARREWRQRLSPGID